VIETTAMRRFRRLYDEHHRAVLSYFVRRVDRDSAYDATQDVYVIAWRKLDSIPDGEMELAWLYTVARGVLLNYRRKASDSRVSFDVSAASDPPSRPSRNHRSSNSSSTPPSLMHSPNCPIGIRRCSDWRCGRSSRTPRSGMSSVARVVQWTFACTGP
jgi:DNA-directed RNA polymerase specialized sigma24 family protein